MDRDLAVAVSAAPRVSVEGFFERHVSPSWAERALLGSASGGRWAAPNAFSVIYLGRPASSVVVEAYRHLVDDIEGMTVDRVRGRRLVRAQVSVDDVLDLRSRQSRLAVASPTLSYSPTLGTTTLVSGSATSHTSSTCTASLPQQPLAWAKLSPSSSTSFHPRNCRSGSATRSSGTRCRRTLVTCELSRHPKATNCGPVDEQRPCSYSDSL